MIVRIQIRRGTATEWTNANPILASGEFGYETDTGKLKIGTGAIVWNSLGYLESGTGGGGSGASAYVYIAYASDDSGTGFTTTFDPALDYIAILSTSTEIATPAAGDFTGLWKYIGPGEAIIRESNTVIFEDIRGYIIGNTAPITGNVAFDFINAKLGSVTTMIHQDASPFTLPGLVISGTISDTVPNYIYFELVNKTPGSEVVRVTISQEVV